MKCFLNIERRFKEIHSEIDVRIAAIFFSHSAELTQKRQMNQCSISPHSSEMKINSARAA